MTDKITIIRMGQILNELYALREEMEDVKSRLDALEKPVYDLDKNGNIKKEKRSAKKSN